MKRLLFFCCLLGAPAAADPSDRAHHLLNLLHQAQPLLKELNSATEQALTPDLIARCEKDYVAFFKLEKEKMDLMTAKAPPSDYSEALKQSFQEATLHQDESASYAITLIGVRRFLQKKPGETIPPGPKVFGQGSPGMWDVKAIGGKAPTPADLTKGKKELQETYSKYEAALKAAETGLAKADSQVK